VVVENEREQIVRPPGVMLDTGGTGKGLCADVVAYRLAGYTRFVVDCGGDIAIGGIGSQLEPYEIAVEHPITGESVGILRLSRGGVATSGLNVRIWRNADGSFGHHLLDPSSGAPVWSGLVGATAVGASALEAETLSKMALLLGPTGARAVLAEHGGVIVHDDGDVEPIGPVDLRPDRGAALGAAA
jgi:thiamine biosynthesis lipoprotein